MKRHMMIWMVMALLCAAASTMVAQETYTISGTIRWKGGSRDGQPVVGASVRIGPGNYTTKTDGSGRYVITGVKSGPHTIHVKAKKPNGSVTKAITVGSDEVVDLTLRSRKLSIRKRNGGVGVQKQ